MQVFLGLPFSRSRQVQVVAKHLAGYAAAAARVQEDFLSHSAAAAAAVADAAVADAARKNTLKEAANIVRKYYPHTPRLK